METFPLNILTFPIWWYITGTRIMFGWAKRSLHFGLQKTGLLLFAKHMREPLFGDYTRSGIIIGFFLRLVLLIFKLFVFSLRVLGIAVVFIGFWLALPFLLSMIIYQLLPR